MGSGSPVSRACGLDVLSVDLDGHDSYAGKDSTSALADVRAASPGVSTAGEVETATAHERVVAPGLIVRLGSW